MFWGQEEGCRADPTHPAPLASASWFPEEGLPAAPSPRPSTFPAGTQPSALPASWAPASHSEVVALTRGCLPHSPASRGGAGSGLHGLPKEGGQPFLPSISLLLGRPGGSGGSGRQAEPPHRERGRRQGRGGLPAGGSGSFAPSTQGLCRGREEALPAPGAARPTARRGRGPPGGPVSGSEIGRAHV